MQLPHKLTTFIYTITLRSVIEKFPIEFSNDSIKTELFKLGCLDEKLLPTVEDNFVCQSMKKLLINVILLMGKVSFNCSMYNAWIHPIYLSS